MREWLPQGHLAYFIGDTVHSLELQAFHDRYAKRGKDGKPEGGRYKREFGTPEAGAQENFTDGDSRIMKRAGGGFDPAYNAQLVVDEAAHIIVAAELTNNASDAAELPNVLKAVQANLGQAPDQVLGRHRVSLGGGVREQLAGGPSELVVALGQAAYRKRKWIAAQRLDQERAGIAPVQPARPAPRGCRVETRLRSAESAKNVRLAARLRGKERDPEPHGRTGMGVAHGAK